MRFSAPPGAETVPPTSMVAAVSVIDPPGCIAKAADLGISIVPSLFSTFRTPKPPATTTDEFAAASETRPGLSRIVFCVAGNGDDELPAAFGSNGPTAGCALVSDVIMTSGGTGEYHATCVEF